MAEQNYAEIFARMASPSLLQKTHEALTIQQQMQNVQAQELQMQAREAMGPILQGAIDKETGALDYNKAFVGMAANPATAWMAPEFLDKAVARQGTQAETALKELEKNQKQAAAIYDGVAGLLPKGQALTRQDMLKVAADLYGSGIIDKQHYVNFAMQLPQDGAPMHNFAKQVALRAQGAAKSLDTVYQDIQARDQGPNIVFTQNDRLGGEVKQVGVLPKGLAPEQSEALVETIDPQTNKTVKAPRSQLFPSGKSPAPAGQQGAGVPQPQGAPPQQGVVTKLAPQVEKAWEKLGENYQQIVDLAKVNQGLEYQLDTVERLVKDYNPNALASVRDKIAGGLQALGVKDELVNQIANGSLGKGQAFKSIVVDFAANKLKAAIGSGKITNMEFDTFQNTKINPNMSPEGIKELIQYYRRGILLDKMYIKGYNHFLSSGKNPTDFENWWQDKLEDVRKRRRGSNG